MRRLVVGLAVAVLVAVGRARAADDEAARVIILANANDRDSVALASFYAGQRHIPDANIVALPLPAAETITWDVFEREVYRPLQAWLIQHQWVDGVMGVTRDSGGEMRISVHGHRIAYLVLCRGVPLRIEADAARLQNENLESLPAPFRTNQASVDGELALLAARNSLHPLAGIIRNPLFNDPQPSAAARRTIVRVARLDGPTVEACERMIRSALVGEERGLAGRAYIDLGGYEPGSPRASGDTWLRGVAAELRVRDFDVEEQPDAALFPDTARFDAPVFYFGWYADNVTGPFRLPGFRFPPGAIALHIHSFSAATLRSETTGWAGPFVALGVAATVGNVYEPYLDLTHHPDKLLAALVAGRTWGEATYHALPVLSWQAVALGDPLFRPFAQSLSAQVTNLPRRADPEAPYVVIREANFLARNGQPADALAWLARGARETPGLALSLRLAQERAKAGERTDAVRALQLFKFMRTLRVDEIGVAAEAGQLFESLGDPAAGVELHRTLLAQSVLTADWRKLLLPRARDAALKAGMMVLHRQWSEELSSPP